jgi:hypothetical protein
VTTSPILRDEGIRPQSDTTTGTAKTLIGRIRRHIEQDKCHCCAAALEEALENVDN